MPIHELSSIAQTSRLWHQEVERNLSLQFRVEIIKAKNFVQFLMNSYSSAPLKQRLKRDILSKCCWWEGEQETNIGLIIQAACSGLYRRFSDFKAIDHYHPYFHGLAVVKLIEERLLKEAIEFIKTALSPNKFNDSFYRLVNESDVLLQKNELNDATSKMNQIKKALNSHQN